MAELGYFEQCETDAPKLLELVERYGVAGILGAMEDIVRSKDTGLQCSNKCSLSLNVVWELQQCKAAIKKWKEDSK